MKKLSVFLFSISIIFLFIFVQKVHSYSGGNVNFINEHDINKFKSIKDEEILVILDYSSSMIKKLNDKSRATHAVYALYELLDILPSNAKIGLRVFGPDEQSMHEYASGINTRRDCTASKLAVSISSNNINRVKSKLSEYTRPFGETPIAYSLMQAINYDFNSSNSLKHIVLITDGGEGCGGDPCKLIRDVMSHRNDIKIDVVAIAGDENNSFMGLSCLSNETNGKFVVVNNANDLYSKLKTSIVFLPETNEVKPEVSKLGQVPQNTPALNISNVNKINQNTKYTNYLFEFNN